MIKLKSLFEGNITKEQILQILKPYNLYINPYINATKYLKNIISIENNSDMIFTMGAPNLMEQNSCVLMFNRIDYLHPNISDDYYYIMSILNFLDLVISVAFYTQLRTIEQLGYIVSSSKYTFDKQTFRLFGQRYLIQSSTHSPKYISERIKEFNLNYINELANISVDEFNSHIISLIQTLNKPFDNLYEEASADANVLLINSTIFNYKEILTEKYEQLTKDDVIKFYQKYYIDDKTRWFCEITGNDNNK